MSSRFKCAACGKTYVVKAVKPDGRYLCPTCKQPLVTAENGIGAPPAKAPARGAVQSSPPAVARQAGRRERKQKSGGSGIAWVAAALLAAVGGWAVYRYAPTGRSPGAVGAKKEAEARKGFSSQGVALTIEEPVGIDRKAEPVTSGVPLPQGSVSDPAQLSLADEKGQPVPCQFTPQCRWPDGSIKWVLLDFQSDVPAKGKAGYKLRIGGSPATPKDSVQVIEAGSTTIVSTGEFSFEVSKDAACLIRSVKLADKAIVTAEKPIQVEMVNADGKAYRASKPTEVVVESKGPVRATVLVRGEFVNDEGGRIFDGKVGYDLRLTACAGRPWVKMDFTLKNNGFYGYRNEKKPREWLYFKSLKIEVPVPGGESAKWFAAMNGKENEPLGADWSATLTQWLRYPRANARGQAEFRFADEEEREKPVGADKIPKGPYFQFAVGSRKYGQAGKAEGHAALSRDTDATVGAAVHRFWQNAPRGFQAVPGKLSVLLWPEGGFWPRTQEAHDAGTYQFEGGRRKTVEILLWTGKQETKPGDLCRTLDSPLFARAPAQWYADTGAVWPFAPPGLEAKDAELAEAMRRYDQLQIAKVIVDAGDPAGSESPVMGDRWGKVSIPNLWDRAPEVFCGWMNYGDLVWSHGYCSLYYQWPYSMLQQYLRLGNREFLDVAEDMVRHRYDIDQYHVVDTAPWLGGFQRYEKGEHGNLARQVPDNTKWERNTAPSHTWNRCLLLHWALTGDPRSMETAQENGQAYRSFFYGQHKLGEKPKLPWGEFRSPGWAIENFLALYEYTGEKKYLDWANEIFTKTLLAMEQENGGKGHIIKDGKQCAQFMGYITEPVARLHRLTGRPDVAEFLKRVLDWQRQAGTMHGCEKDRKYLPTVWTEDWGDAPSAEDPEITIGAGNSYSFPLADGYAYLYQVYGRQQDLDFARKLFKEAVFYYGLGNGAAPGQRTPIGYHYEGSPFGSTPKINAWSGRYCQIYLAAEEQSGAKAAK